MAAVVLVLVIIEGFGTDTHLLSKTMPHLLQSPDLQWLLSSRRPLMFEPGLHRQEAVARLCTSPSQTFVPGYP